MENCLGNKRSKIFIIIIIFMIVLTPHQTVYGQNAKIKISRPEIFWAIAHPFQVRKALNISKIAIAITDSIENDSILTDRSGGQLDAFKHGIWMAILTKEIGGKAAIKLGNAHEKANYLNFKKGRPYSSHMHTVMDSLNNISGAKRGNDSLTTNQMIVDIIAGVKEGEFHILKKDKLGNYISCKGNEIEILPYQWEQYECLVKSNMIEQP